jgi:hypothetical protein
VPIVAATGSTALKQAQVFFRSSVYPTFTISLSDLTKIYGSADPSNLRKV